MPPIPRPGGGASKLQLPSKWEGGTGSGPSWGWDVVAEHPCPGRVRRGANRGLRLPPFRASQKVLHWFTCPLKEPLFDHLEFRGELFQARRVLPATFEKSFLLLKKLLSGITRFYYPQKYSTFFDGRQNPHTQKVPLRGNVLINVLSNGESHNSRDDLGKVESC